MYFNDAGQLANVRIYRRRVQGNTVIQNWSLRATLTPSGALQTQSWTDNTITTAQLYNGEKLPAFAKLSESVPPDNDD